MPMCGNCYKEVRFISLSETGACRDDDDKVAF